MGTDEIAIIDYLKQFPKTFTSASEICKKAGGRRRYARDPEWAKPALRRLEADGHLETDAWGHYKITTALLLKYTQQSREAQRIERSQNAVKSHITNMAPEDDEKPFSLIIRQALTSDYGKDVGLHPDQTEGEKPNESASQ